MKEMSLRQAIEFWTYLDQQAELKKQAFISTPSGSSYKDEARAEAETYEHLAEVFSRNFGQPIASTDEIHHGITAEQAEGFLHYLDEKIIEFEVAQEKTRRKRMEALAELKDAEYYRVRSIYKEMENLEDCQIGVFEDSHENFISILRED